MAKEISLVAKFGVLKGFAITKEESLKIDVTGAAFVNAVQNIATTQEQIVIPPEIATAGYAFFKNLDGTNYVEIGLYIASTFYPLIHLKPLEVAVLRLATTTFYAKAHTAAVNLEFCVVQD